MANAKKPRKKYKAKARPTRRHIADSGRAVISSLEDIKHRAMLEQKELAVREAFMGARLSYNSRWDDGEFFPSEYERAQELLQNDCYAVQMVFVSWHFDWHVILTVYCQDDYGKFYDQVVEAIRDDANVHAKGPAGRARKVVGG